MSYSRDQIRKALLELVARRDPTVFQNPENFEKQLQLIGNWPSLPEISALKAGLQERFPWELQKDPNRVVSEKNVEILASSLVKRHQIESSVAIWAVETWGLSLGLKVLLPDQANKPETTPTASDSETKTSKFIAPTANSAPTAPKPPSPQTPASQDQQAQPSRPAPAFKEPDTSSTRLGVIFGTDDSGLIRVYKSWFDNAPDQEANGLIASTIKVEGQKIQPLFTPAPRPGAKQARKPARIPSPAKPPDNPQMIKQVAEQPVQKPEADSEATTKASSSAMPHAPSQPPETTEGDKLLAKANSLLPGGAGRLDVREALNLLQIAVKKGSLLARRRFGEIYLKGIGVNSNIANAASWFKTAAEKGDAESQFQLGSLYQCGVGVEQNLEMAQLWLQRAAEQGHKGASELLQQILQA